MGARDLVFTVLGIDKGSETLDKVGDAADRAGGRLDSLGKVSIKSLAGAAGAAVAAGVVTAGAIAGMTVGFGALGIASAAQSTVVSDAWGEMSQHVGAEFAEFGQPLIPALARIATQTRSTFDALEPQIKEATAASAVHVETLATGVLGFARGAMPGMLTAVKSADPVMRGFQSLLIDSGRGTGEFFAEVSEGSEGAGSILSSLGQIVKSALGFFGGFFANLANEGAPTVQRIATLFDRFLGVVDRLGGGSMPVLFGAANTVLDVLGALLAIVGPIASQLGGVLGVVLSLAAGFKLLHGAVGAIRGMAGNIDTFVTSIRKADGGAGGLRGKLSGLGGFLGGPFGIALGGAALLLGALGEGQARAAANAEQHRNSVSKLAQILRENNGIINESVRVAAAKELGDTKLANTQKNILQIARELGISQSTVTDAYLGNAEAQKVLSSTYERLQGEMKHGQELTDSGTEAEKTRSGSLGLLNFWLNQNRDTMKNAAEANKDLTNATQSTTTATDRLKEALAAEQAQALAGIDKQFAYEQSLRGIESAQNSTAEAQKRHTEAVKTHGARSEEARIAELAERDAVGQLNTAIRSAIVSAGDYAVSTSGATEESTKTRISIEAQNREAIRLAQSFSGPLPTALAMSIGSMDNTSLAAIGVKRSVDAAGNAVYTLPNGKVVTLSAADQASPAIQSVQNQLNILTRTPVIVTLSLHLANDPKRLIQSVRDVTARAGGGPVRRGEMYLVGEEGPEFMIAPRDGTVIPADVTASIRSGQAGSTVAVQTSSVPGSSGSGMYVNQLVVQPLSGRFRLSDVETELRFRGLK